MKTKIMTLLGWLSALLVVMTVSGGPLALQAQEEDVSCVGKPIKEWFKSKRQRAREEEEAQEKRDKPKSKDEKAYDELVREAKVDSGLVVTILKDDRLYFEVPDSLLGRPLLFTSRVARTSDPSAAVAGQMMVTPFLATLEARDGAHLEMKLIPTVNQVPDDDPIKDSFDRNFGAPVVKTFEVKARTKGTKVIDVTSFFQSGEPLFESRETSFGSPISGGEYILSAKSFEKNVEVESVVSYGQQYRTMVIHRSMVLLPEEPMTPRRSDSRVGYFSSPRTLYSSTSDRLEQYDIIHRWRLEPSDSTAYARGEVVDPVEPIVFYVDTAFPPKWRQAVLNGICDWERAFRAAGFSNAIEARLYPSETEMPDFDPDDLRFSCVKYAASDVANAMGPSYVDPRSGEILCGDVIWYHNVSSLLYYWRFVQTAATDPRVRGTQLPDSLMAEAMRYVASHEIGHTLGLEHNMGASSAFSPEQLRDPAFTQTNGTTPSIMDYARFNYVAQPGDLERGVRLIPPLLGPYDIYAIEWGYRCYAPEEEKSALRRLIESHTGDRRFLYGPQQMNVVDPTAQTEDLSSDQIAANTLGIKNLRYITPRFEAWLAVPGEPSDDLMEVYDAIVGQMLRYLRHVTPIVGGRLYHDVRQGDGQMPVTYISAERQREALSWTFDQLRQLDDWLFTPYFAQRYDRSDLTGRYTTQTLVLSLVLSDLTEGYRLQGIIDGSEAPRGGSDYPMEDYLRDYVDLLLAEGAGGAALSRSERSLQQTGIEKLLTYVSPDGISTVAPHLQDEADEWVTALPGTMPEEVSAARMNYFVPSVRPEVIAPYIRVALERIRATYRSRAAETTDATTRAYYRGWEQTFAHLLDKK